MKAIGGILLAAAFGTFLFYTPVKPDIAECVGWLCGIVAMMGWDLILS